jgi:hypothetical protein
MRAWHGRQGSRRGRAPRGRNEREIDGEQRMTVDDGTPGLKRRLNVLALLAVVLAIAVARACSTSPLAGAPGAGAPDEGTSVSKDHGASAGKAGESEPETGR